MFFFSPLSGKSSTGGLFFCSHLFSFFNNQLVSVQAQDGVEEEEGKGKTPSRDRSFFNFIKKKLAFFTCEIVARSFVSAQSPCSLPASWRASPPCSYAFAALRGPVLRAECCFLVVDGHVGSRRRQDAAVECRHPSS